MGEYLDPSNCSQDENNEDNTDKCTNVDATCSSREPTCVKPAPEKLHSIDQSNDREIATFSRITSGGSGVSTAASSRREWILDDKHPDAVQDSTRDNPCSRD